MTILVVPTFLLGSASLVEVHAFVFQNLPGQALSESNARSSLLQVLQEVLLLRTVAQRRGGRVRELPLVRERRRTADVLQRRVSWYL